MDGMTSEFPFMESVPVGPSHAEKRAQELLAWKEQWGVWTHYAEGSDWLAVAIGRCHEQFKGYDLTPEELAYPDELFVSYCRLIDEAGLCADGCATEEEACKALAFQCGFVAPALTD